MKLAIITDNSAFLPAEIQGHPDLFVLTIPVTIEGKSYIEGINLTPEEFYEKMARSQELPKTSQPSVAELEALLQDLPQKGYTHAIGLFLSSGISGFWQNIQYLADEAKALTVAFPDTLITSAPLGSMVEQALILGESGADFDLVMDCLNEMIDKTAAYIMVDDLDHLVKGGRLSNGAALLGNLLKIKPILFFNQGKIEVYEKIRTEKKAVKRLIEILKEAMQTGDYNVMVIHANCEKKAYEFQAALEEEGITDVSIVPFGAVIGTHLGSGAVAVGICPRIGE